MPREPGCALAGSRVRGGQLLGWSVPVGCVLGALLGLGTASAAGAKRPALPDLLLPREGVSREGGQVRFVVENRGSAPSQPSEVELWDRPPLLGPTGTWSPYPFTPNQAGMRVSQEPAGADTVALEIAIGRDPRDGPVRGRLVLHRGGGLVVPAGLPSVAADSSGKVLRWELRAREGGLRIPVKIPTPPGENPVVTLVLRPSEEESLPRVTTYRGNLYGVTHRFVLDCLQRPRARRRRVPIPPLAPGERFEGRCAFVGGVRGEVFAWVDPDDVLEEEREGNNCTSWRRDRDRRCLAALHVHSCFSEGAGSFDWQCYHAALSGYDLVWWSEHDWRISCHDHLHRVGFEEGEGTELTFEARGEGAAAEITAQETLSGRGALRLALGGRGRARAWLRAERKRLGYSLASGVRLGMHVLARHLRGGERFVVSVELSHHPGEKRRLLYDFRGQGVVDSPQDAGGDVIRRAISTGGWVPVTLPLSRDADSVWVNGADDNVIEVRFELFSEQGGAEVLVDDIEITHEVCGDGLRRLQAAWAEDYPNLAHRFGEEVSYRKPHLNQYGGRRGLFDYGKLWEEEFRGGYVETVVRRVHDALGIVSWCHPFGVPMNRRVRRLYGAAYRDSLIGARFGGTDLLEVGFRKRATAPLEEYLGFWDAAGMRGVVITGIGVNDSHEWAWGPWENDFGTWLEAPASDEAALLAALRRGRVFFGDPLAFRGWLTIRAGSARAGDVVALASPRTVVLEVEGAPKDATLRLVSDGRVRREWGGLEGEGTYRASLAPGEARVVRAELWGAAGAPLAFTNPIYFGAGVVPRRARP